MKWALASFVVVLLSVCTASCGSTSKDSTSHTSANTVARRSVATTPSNAALRARQRKFPDEDSDSPSIVLDYGHAASPTVARAVTAIVKRYYTSAVADDGAAVCALIVPVLKTAIPEDYGQSPGPTYLRGKTCAVVMSKLSKQRHQLLTGELATLTVTGVRVNGTQAYALLRFRTTPEPRYIPLQLESGVWKINALSDRELS